MNSQFIWRINMHVKLKKLEEMVIRFMNFFYVYGAVTGIGKLRERRYLSEYLLCLKSKLCDAPVYVPTCVFYTF